MVGAYGDETRGFQAGAVHLFYGPITRDLTTADADAAIYGEYSYQWFGWAVDSSGDLNGDGYDDVVVTAENDANNGCQTGKVFVFYGPLSGVSIATSASAQLIGNVLGDGAGASVSTGGDVNADGYDDLLIGAGGIGCTAYEGIGHAYLMYEPLFGVYDLSQADAVMEGAQIEDGTGESVALGDFDQDGHAEVVVAAPSYILRDGEEGQVYILRHPVEGLIPLHEVETFLRGDLSGGFAGSGLAVGNVNGDGYTDLVVGASGSRNTSTPGRLYLELGGPLRTSARDAGKTPR
mgnify:CR=1 FL=1